MMSMIVTPLRRNKNRSVRRLIHIIAFGLDCVGPRCAFCAQPFRQQLGCTEHVLRSILARIIQIPRIIQIAVRTTHMHRLCSHPLCRHCGYLLHATHSPHRAQSNDICACPIQFPDCLFKCVALLRQRFESFPKYAHNNTFMICCLFSHGLAGTSKGAHLDYRHHHQHHFWRLLI